MDIEKISKHGRGAQSPARPLCDAEARREGGTSPLCPRNLLTAAVLTLLMVACAICVGDADEDEGTTTAVSTSFDSGDLTYTVLSDADRTVSITGSKPNLESISFVENVSYDENTYRVTAISGSEEEDAYKGAFQNQTGLASVTIPDYITSIGAKAFSGCVNLGELTIGSGVTSIGDEAFKGCKALWYISWPGTNAVQSIGEEAFSGCVKLGDLTIGASVESVGAGAFTDCGTNSGSSTYGNGIFLDIYCNIPDRETGMFGGVSNIYGVYIESSVQTIGKNAFKGCSGLTKVYADGKTSIGDYAFEGCTAISYAEFPSVKTIGEGAFKGCSGIPSISLTDEASIGDYAFEGCTAISFVSIPSVKTIGEGAFKGCSDITSITLRNVTSIGDYAFEGCTDISSAEFPSVKTIGEGAFRGCSQITSISLPESVNLIGAYAFSGTGIGSISIPDSVTAIGEKAFANCQLSTISFGAGIQTVAGNAFGSDGGSFTATGFYKSDGTSPLSLTDGLDEFKGRTFTGNITKMVRSESYTLTFDPDNGTGTRTETHSLGDTITKPADPEKTGYDFQYWMKADGTEFDFTTETMPASDLTLKALWKAKAFTVTYITGTGTDPTQSCDYGSTISLPDGKSGSIVFSKTGYKLTGWQAEGASETLSPGTGFTVTSDITFTAVWKAVPAPSEDDDDGYSPTVVPGRSTGGGSSDSSIPVAAVAIAAGCAAVLALLAMLVYFPKR